MLMPSIFRENLFDDFMMNPWGSDFFSPSAGSKYMMNTDVKEKENAYELDIELPGFKKEDVRAELKDGYLTISATQNTNRDEKDEKGSYIRRERYSGSCSRSFYVGEGVKQEDIHARFENGVLKLEVPKADKQKVEEKKYIAIEG